VEHSRTLNNSKHNHRIAIQAIAAGGCLEGAK
jgi:hypothetical protein